MNQKHLLRFIKKKVKAHGDDIVNVVNGKPITLSNVRILLYVIKNVLLLAIIKAKHFIFVVAFQRDEHEPL